MKTCRAGQFSADIGIRWLRRFSVSHPRGPIKSSSLFIASGRGVRHRMKIGAVVNIDVAPTIGHLLGYELHSAVGKVLSESYSMR